MIEKRREREINNDRRRAEKMNGGE